MFSYIYFGAKKPILLSLRSITDKASPLSISQPLKLVTSMHISPGPTLGPGSGPQPKGGPEASVTRGAVQPGTDRRMSHARV